MKIMTRILLHNLTHTTWLQIEGSRIPFCVITVDLHAQGVMFVPATAILSQPNLYPWG